MMMAANLVGFVVGTDSVSYFFKELLGTSEGKGFFLLLTNGSHDANDPELAWLPWLDSSPYLV
jgi:hypothetical protein